MTGSLFQLIARGAEDIYLISKPMISMFKIVYRRHQDFSIYDIIKIPKAKQTFGINFEVELDRCGDLLHKVYLIVELPILTFKKNNNVPTFAWVKELGHRLIKEVSVYIGDQMIDKHNYNLLHLISELRVPDDLRKSYNNMIGNNYDMYEISSNNDRSVKKLHIPLFFWFCNHAGNALPMISLLHTKVFLRFKIESLDKLLYLENGTELSKVPQVKYSILAQYVYLEPKERMRMAEARLEYLIEKYNYNGVNYIDKTSRDIMVNNPEIYNQERIPITFGIKININDPIKYFIWYMKAFNTKTEHPVDIIDWTRNGFHIRNYNGNFINYPTGKFVSGMKFTIFGVDREHYHAENYYTYIVPYSRNCQSISSGEYMYSFALYPMLLQPSGTANYSETEDSYMHINFTNQVEDMIMADPNIRIKYEMWGMSINILRIISGMGALLFVKE